MLSVHTAESAEAQEASNRRRRHRYELKRFLADMDPTTDELFTSLPRVAKCGRNRIDASKPFGMGVTPSGHACETNVQRCGSVWACPTCQPKVRQARADEINRAVEQQLDRDVEKVIPAKYKRDGTLRSPERRYYDGGVLFITVTLPHDEGDALAPLWTAAAESWRAIWSGEAGMFLREDFGIVGAIRALEVTNGSKGWHPHLHVVVFLEERLDAKAQQQLADAVYLRWACSVESFGYRRPSRAHGIDLVPVTKSEGFGEYVVGMELARLDLKAGRKGSRSPLEILASAADALDRLSVRPDQERGRNELALWREFEQASKGKNQLTWTPGLKAMFDLEERTDEDIVNDNDDVLAQIEYGPHTWSAVCRRAYGVTRVKEALERGGAGAALALLAAWNLPAWAAPPSSA